MKISKILMRPSFYLNLTPEDQVLLNRCAASHPERQAQQLSFAALSRTLDAAHNAARIKPDVSVPFTSSHVHTMCMILENETALETAHQRSEARLLRMQLNTLLGEHPARNVTQGDVSRGRTELASL